MGRDWLVALRYKLTQLIERRECKTNKQKVNFKESICEISLEEKRNPEALQLVRELPKLFKRKGRVKYYEIIKIKMENDAKIIQQKGRRVPIQYQTHVAKAIDNLLKEGHIENNDETQDDVFIQPTVITVKKR